MRPGHVLSAWREHLVAGGDLAGVDQRLAVHAEDAALLAFGAKARFVAKIIVDAVDDVEAESPGRQHTGRQHRQQGKAPARRTGPGFLDQIIVAEHQAAETRIGTGNLLGVEDGQRRFHHGPQFGARRRLRHQRCGANDVRCRRNLGHQNGIGCRRHRRYHVVPAPGRIEGVDADHQFAPSIATGRHGPGHPRPGFRLGLGCHRILEIENQRVGGEAASLFQSALIGAWHIENAAAWSDGHVNSRNAKLAFAAQYVKRGFR